MLTVRILSTIALVVIAAGCEPEHENRRPRPPSSQTARDASSGPGDGSQDRDAAEPDSGKHPDAGGLDAGALDGGGGLDGGGFLDASARPDGGAQDAQPADVAFRDAEPADTGPTDTGGWLDATAPADAGFAPDAAAPPDAGPPDSGVAPDAGQPGSGDIWVEIDYSSASTSRSPAWRFSSTPGWGSAQWAAENATRPEAWDRWNNMSVVNDPIGRSLEIGGSSELQLMIGLEELLAYSSATVRIEGRSRSTSSSVQFDVYNPWNGCGVSTTLGNQWQVQVVELDLATCFVVGGGVQAVRVSPVNGTVALVRMRLTLHGAAY